MATRYRASISRLADPYPRAEWGAMQFGFYAQDQIDLSDRFNVSLGLRAGHHVHARRAAREPELLRRLRAAHE